MLLKDYFALSYIMTHPIQNHITTRNADFYHMHCYMAPDQIEELELPKNIMPTNVYKEILLSDLQDTIIYLIMIFNILL